MAVRSLRDHVDSILSRHVVKPKSDGVSDPDGEAQALFESIGLNLLLHPKAVLYVAHLARNALLRVLNEEISSVDTLIKTVQDLGNPSFVVRSTNLKKARVALLQMEGLDKVDPSNEAFKRYDNAVSEFLEKSISKMVRRPGSTELTRPGEEAFQDLPTDFANLKTKHVEMLERLYSLAVGIDNFLSTPLQTILGIETVFRTREDLEDILNQIEQKTAHQSARDIVTRLISSRAALKSIGSLPGIFDPLVTGSLPKGYALRARSAPARASFNTNPGFHSFNGASLGITVNSAFLGYFTFPQSTFELGDSACIVGSTILPSPTLSSGKSLFITMRDASQVDLTWTADGHGKFVRSFKIDLPSGATTISAIISAIDAGITGYGTCAEFAANGSNRILICSTAAAEISISDIYTEEDPLGTPGVPLIFTNSGHTEIGFTTGQTGIAYEFPSSLIADALNIIFDSLPFTATLNEDDTVTLSTDSDAPGAFLGASIGAFSVGLNRAVFASSNQFQLYGTVLGKEQDPVNPEPLVDIGDVVTTPSGKFSITRVNEQTITLSQAVNTFDAVVTIESGLALAIGELSKKLKAFLTTWLKNPYAQGLDKLESSMSTLVGSQSAAVRNTVVSQLSGLRGQLSAIKDLVTSEATIPPEGSGSSERELVLGIVNTLEERKFDRAADMLLRCQIQELFELDSQDASFGGSLLKAMQTFAQTDIHFPNLSEDEGDSPNAVVDGGRGEV